MWFRPILRVEDEILYRARRRLPTQAHLHGEDAHVAGYAVNERLGITTVERMVPGANASPYMVQHVARYVWAMGIARGRTVVDLGTGDGYGAELLAWVSPSVIGVDVDEGAITDARRRWDGAEYVVGDLTDADRIPAAEIGVCFEVLEHIAEASRVLETASQRFSRLLLSVPNPLAGGSHINPHHVNDWPLSTVKGHLRTAGARHIRTYGQGLRSHRVRRGARPWHVSWLLDAQFPPTERRS